MKLLTYNVVLDGKEFTCHGSLDSYGEWQWDSLYIGQQEVDDWLKFLSDYCQPLVMTLSELCGEKVLAEDFAEDWREAA